MTRHLRDVALLLLLGENSRRVASTDGGGGGGQRRREYGVSSGIEVEDDDDEVESNEVPASLALEEVIPSTSTSSSSTSTSFSSSSLSSSSLRDRRANGDSLRRRRRLIGSADGNDDNGDGDLIDNNNNIFYPSPIRLMRGELLKQQRLGRRATSSYEVGGAVTAPGCGPTPGTHHSPYLGCYSDKKDDRAFPYELYGGMPSRFEHGALDCERECTKRGFRYFGREYIGQCFCGNAIDDITRHGMDDGCDCCGTNVGEGKMCVWEDADHPDSRAKLPYIPVVLPMMQSQSSSRQEQPLHAHLTDLVPIQSNVNKNNQVPAVVNQASTTKPMGGFRIRLHWERGYNWQGSPEEKFWCMECRGDCRSGSVIQIDDCTSTSARQKFIAIAKTLRPASNPALCITVTGYNGRDSPVKLRDCDRGSSSQNFLEVRKDEKFELRSQDNADRCLSQHHHPKRAEVVYPEKCDKTRATDTSYWNIY
ncbi:hypothetical protein ACHAXA_002914 [Cyclostephanos tholiformis]|uniref:WSC domain-containing protein n=1 Tax=Cyclostephanos tholiformis TaxID=382380 RepID=A0ABD3SH10_9STRA